MAPNRAAHHISPINKKKIIFSVSDNDSERAGCKETENVGLNVRKKDIDDYCCV